MNTAAPAPVLFIPHGGGPRPLLGDPEHRSLTEFLRTIGQAYAKPEAILVVSAHWEASQPTLLGQTRPELYYDYYNFPPESYQLNYPADNPPALQQQVLAALRQQGIAVETDANRGYDHGVFVPLLLMQPRADLPVLQLSLTQDLDPAKHIELGRALASLRAQGVMILGSGLSFHNMQAFRGGSNSSGAESVAFHDWLVESLTDADLSAEQRFDRLAQWQQAPMARFCHPREEHLLPLHVCLGAAEGAAAEIVFDEPVLGHRAIGALWR